MGPMQFSCLLVCLIDISSNMPLRMSNMHVLTAKNIDRQTAVTDRQTGRRTDSILADSVYMTTNSSDVMCNSRGVKCCESPRDLTDVSCTR